MFYWVLICFWIFNFFLDTTQKLIINSVRRLLNQENNNRDTFALDLLDVLVLSVVSDDHRVVPVLVVNFKRNIDLPLPSFCPFDFEKPETPVHDDEEDQTKGGPNGYGALVIVVDVLAVLTEEGLHLSDEWIHLLG